MIVRKGKHGYCHYGKFSFFICLPNHEKQIYVVRTNATNDARVEKFLKPEYKSKTCLLKTLESKHIPYLNAFLAGTSFKLCFRKFLKDENNNCE